MRKPYTATDVVWKIELVWNRRREVWEVFTTDGLTWVRTAQLDGEVAVSWTALAGVGRVVARELESQLPLSF